MDIKDCKVKPYYPIKELPIISRKRIEEAIPLADCTNRQIEPWLREDIIRYCIFCAEIQRDADLDKIRKLGVEV